MLKTNYPAFSPANGGSYGDCNGTHSAEDLSTGKISPYTKIDPRLNEKYGFSGDRSRLFVFKPIGNNLTFVITTLPVDTLALENKLGVRQGFIVDFKHIGLMNFRDVNMCMDIDDGTVHCNDPTAIYGNLYYSIGP